MLLLRPIQTQKFPENKIAVSHPKDEPMVLLDSYFDCDSKYNHWSEDDGNPLPGSSPHIAARRTVTEKLLQAEKLLPEGYRFRIYDAYRPIAVQQALWDYYRAKKVQENPEKTPEEIDRLTAFCVSFPSYNILNPSLHNTGGAVDLTIVDENENELNMGCEFDEFTNKAWTNHFEITSYNDIDTKNIRQNRRLLYNVMTTVGFTNLPSEWWHYDYGNDKWAQFNRTAPFYAGVLDLELSDSEPYPLMKEIRELDKKQQDLVKIITEARNQCINCHEIFVQTRIQ